VIDSIGGAITEAEAEIAEEKSYLDEKLAALENHLMDFDEEASLVIEVVWE
jgi:hypothetical protein